MLRLLQNIPLGYYVLSSFVNFATALTISLIVFLSKKKSQANKIFATFSFSVAYWSLLYFVWLMTKSKEWAEFYLRSCMIGVLFMPSLFVHFVASFLNLKINKKFILANYILSILFMFTVYTTLYARDIGRHLVFPYWLHTGPIFHLALIHFGAVVLYSFYLMWQCIKKEKGIFRNQILYVFIGTAVGYVSGVTNFFCWYRIKIPPFLNIFVSVYVIMVAVAVLKYRLMDINVALTRVAIFIFVYALILGIPFGLASWGRPWLISIFGQSWFWLPLVLGVGLASAGPFIFLFLQRRTEDLLLKDQRRYQKALRELSKTLTRIRDLDKLIQAIVLTVVDTVKVSFAAIYLKDEEYKSYRLKHYFPQKEKSRFQEFIPLEYPLIKALYNKKVPLPSEEIGPQDKISLDSGLVIPCFIAEGNLLGFLCLGHKPNNQMYTTDDLIVFETLSYSTSLAIENSQFWREIEEHQRQARIQKMDLFSYSLAHEIDNPMNNIKTVASYLKDFFLKELNLPLEKQKEIESGLNSILGSQERVSGMVKAIEEFGKPTTGEFSPLKLEEVLKNYFDLYLPEFKYHGIFFTKELPGKIPYIRGVKQELMQILANFSNNSIHALLATKEKKIHLKIEVPNSDFIRIIFKDNGYGIRQEKLSSIFAPFVTSKASTEGKGMGLYTIRRIIERHKGRVWAESEGKGKGATFYIELPIAKDVTEEDFKKEDRGKRLF